MPLNKDKYLKDFNKYFGIVYVESLSAFEANIYNKYHFQNKTPEQLNQEAKDKYSYYAHRESFVGEFVEELKKSDSYIIEAHEKIASLLQENKELENKLNKIKAEELPPKEKERQNILSNVAKLQAELQSVEQKAHDEYDKRIAELDKQEENRKIKLTAQRNTFKARLSDIIIEENKIQNYNASIIDKRYYLNMEKEGLNTNSKKYISISDELKKLDAEIERCTKILNDYQVEKANMEAENEIIDKEYNDSSKRDKLAQEASEKRKVAGDKIRAKLQKEFGKLDPVQKEFDRINKAINDNVNTFETNKTTINNIEIACIGYARKLAADKKEEALKEIKETEQYETIEKVLNNNTPHVSPESIMRGLKTVKIAYQEYRSKHGFFGRLFRFLPFTSAHADYKEFSDVRTAYCSLSNISEKEVNTYLDNNQLTNTLLQESNKFSQKTLDNILNKEAVMDKDTYKRQPGASIHDYLEAVEDVYKTEINVFQPNMGYALIASNKGLAILEELGNIKRENNSNEVNQMIEKVKNATIQFGAMSKKTENITKEVENILKPVDQREVIVYEMPKLAKEMYENAKLEEEKKFGNKENAILFRNDCAFSKYEIIETTNIVVEEANLANQEKEEEVSQKQPDLEKENEREEEIENDKEYDPNDRFLDLD